MNLVARVEVKIVAAANWLRQNQRLNQIILHLWRPTGTSTDDIPVRVTAAAAATVGVAAKEAVAATVATRTT
jgi:hypothetical protein